MSELDKLEVYLKENNIPYERYEVSHRWECGEDLSVYIMDRHQICVPKDGEKCEWDAICQYGSYGYEDGLLEIYGDIVNPQVDGNVVVGYLKAKDVIKRIEERMQHGSISYNICIRVLRWSNMEHDD